MIQILERAERERVGRWKVAGRLGKRLSVSLEIVELGQLLPGNLLLEQRSEHNGRGAGVFEAFDAVEVVGQR